MEIESTYLRLVQRDLPRPLHDALVLGAVLFRELHRDAVMVRAATLSFWSLLAMVPVLVLTVAVTRPLGLEAVLPIREVVYRAFLAGPVAEVSQTVDELLIQVDFGKLGIAGVVGVLITGSRIYFSVEEAYNALWNVRTRRTFTTRMVVFYATVTLGPVLVAWGFLMSHRLQAAVDVSSFTWLVPVAVTAVAFVLAIRVLPDTTVRWAPATVGGLVSAVFFEFAKALFGAYTSFLGAADVAAKIYGSLGLFPVFLLWLYVLWTIVLIGVEVAYVTQRRHDLVHAEERRITGGDLGQPDALFALQCLLAVARRFIGGSGPVSEPTVTKLVGSEPQVTASALDNLCAIGVLAEAEAGFLPARPLQGITAAEVLALYRESVRPRTDGAAPGATLLAQAWSDPGFTRTVAELAREEG